LPPPRRRRTRDLTQLANLEEFVGGIAVVASLIYVVVHVRQNSPQLRQGNEIQKAAASREFARECNAIMLDMMVPARLAGARGQRGDKLRLSLGVACITAALRARSPALPIVPPHRP
jgi:hypothetical protein